MGDFMLFNEYLYSNTYMSQSCSKHAENINLLRSHNTL